MLRNHLLIALRNLSRYPGYSAVNVLGLAAGLAVCLVILLYVQHELSYDRFHENRERLHLVATHLPSGDDVRVMSTSPVALGDALATEFPEIEAVTVFSLNRFQETLVAGPRLRAYEGQFAYAGKDFFSMFDFEVVAGNPAGLVRPFTVLLSESMSQKYFGEESPLGSTLTIDSEQEYEIIGIFQDVPTNSHLQFDFLASVESHFASGRHSRDNWRFFMQTYVLLHEGRSARDLDAKLPAFGEEHTMGRIRPDMALSFNLIPLASIRLHSGVEWGLSAQNDIRYIYLLSGIALLILVIACINYMNLATARSAVRGREVGVRKTVGARRGELAAQFLTESLLVTSVAFAAALTLAALLLPAFNHVMETQLSTNLWGNARSVLLLLGVLIFTGLLAGSYPALVLSSFRPALVLKGQRITAGKRRLRKGLVVFQFGTSIVLIICTAVILTQMRLVQQSRPGFDRDQVVVIPTHGAIGEAYATFKHELLLDPQIAEVTTTSWKPGRPWAMHFFQGSDIEGADPDAHFRIFGFDVDADFPGALNLEVVSGRSFSDAFGTDEDHALLINQEAARQLGWDEPLGRRIVFAGSERQVVGVLGDFHFMSLHEEISPAIFYLTVEASQYVMAKVGPGNLSATLATIEAQWNALVPQRPFEFAFLDEQFDALYRTEIRAARLFSAASLVAIIVACLGLFGLATLMAEQRTREIGIRKVLGASVASVVALLSREFAALVALAFLLGAPLAYITMTGWLESFVYRIELGPGIFAVAGCAVLLLALVTVAGQALRVAVSDPVKSLRAE